MIIDTADDTTHQLENLKKAGVTGIIRYYSKSTWKRLTAKEARAIADAGMAIGTIYEDGIAGIGDRAESFSTFSGLVHANAAMAQAAVCGQPEGSAIYFAVDFDPTNEEIQTRIIPYFRAVSATIGNKFRIGAYASGECCRELMELLPDLLPWITCSLGFNGTRQFLFKGKQVLYQGTFDGHGNPNPGCDKTLCGLSVDYNTPHQDDWGQFVPSRDTEPPPPIHDAVWMQKMLGVLADGVVGPKTVAAMIKYIEDHEK